MTQNRIPAWLQTDLFIVIVALAMIGVGVWIAP
ncbi:hypothetical protein SAMN05444050_1627 [Afipia sp. GAS231]|nr:hypothetical protein SAMN05444050_1627 [Afipia sp. GAS231]